MTDDGLSCLEVRGGVLMTAVQTEYLSFFISLSDAEAAAAAIDTHPVVVSKYHKQAPVLSAHSPLLH